MDKVVRETNLEISPVTEATDRFITNIGKVIVGKKETVELVLIALLFVIEPNQLLYA